MQLDLEGIILSLEKSPGILRELAGSIAPGEAAARRRPGFWSIGEHVEHLAQTQPMLHGRIIRFRDEKAPAFVPFIPDDSKPVAKAEIVLSDSLAKFDEWRKRQLDAIRTLHPADFAKEGSHPEYRQYTLPILIRHILMHDHWHMYRIEELWLTQEEYLGP
ncbi:MAG: DinB family protein [Spirochaetes bacterium]|nr:MAG: DinB family protein [Spirochaetota bacterium]